MNLSSIIPQGASTTNYVTDAASGVGAAKSAVNPSMAIESAVLSRGGVNSADGGVLRGGPRSWTSSLHWSFPGADKGAIFGADNSANQRGIIIVGGKSAEKSGIIIVGGRSSVNMPGMDALQTSPSDASEVDNLRLQTQMSSHNNATAMAANLLKKSQDAQNGILHNIS